jgi:D-serine deaminase-like pyridoxal phosphate-dependent protein
MMTGTADGTRNYALSRAELGFFGAEMLPTPAVAVDRARLIANIAGARRLMPDTVALRPHIKTHKCHEIAKLQADHGATGFTCAKPGEAIAMLGGGVRSITVGYPIVLPAAAERVMRAARDRGVQARFVVDSAEGVAALATSAAVVGGEWPVYVEVDTGLKRCGVDPATDQASRLAGAICAAKGLTFSGLFTHEGHAYAGKTPEGVRAVASIVKESLASLKARIAKCGTAVPNVSTGSTPTLYANAGWDVSNEARPGNYVFADLTPVRLGLVPMNSVALAVAATVVSANRDYAIIDAGSKTLSSDLAPHSAGDGASYGLAYALEAAGVAEPLTVARLSEEHGFLALDGRRLPIGARVLVFPNHSCPVANLVDELMVLDDGGRVERWRVAARGAIR